MKEHFKKYKVVYLCMGAAVASAGITYLIMRGNAAMIQGVVAPEIQGVTGGPDSVQAKSFIFSLRNSGDITTNIHQGHRGHPGFRTKNLDTGRVYPTQYQAAKAHGVSPSLMSGHLNGKFPDIDGMHFDRVYAETM